MNSLAVSSLFRVSANENSAVSPTHVFCHSAVLCFSNAFYFSGSTQEDLIIELSSGSPILCLFILK